MIAFVQLDLLEEAARRRDEAIALAVDHADTVVANWSETAFAFLKSFALEHATFTIEDVRLASENSVPLPPHARAWGGVAQRGAKSGLLVSHGFAQSRRVDGHRMNLRVWRSTACEIRSVAA